MLAEPGLTSGRRKPWTTGLIGTASAACRGGLGGTKAQAATFNVAAGAPRLSLICSVQVRHTFVTSAAGRYAYPNLRVAALAITAELTNMLLHVYEHY